MITIQASRQNITVKGHADYSKYGTDIVCAGVSTLLISHYNLMLRFMPESNFTCTALEGDFRLIIKKLTLEIEKIMDNLLASLEELALDYPKNIKLERN
ncbi:MAG: ribosomal-processing cysteine protease Prp [Erysipelotrichales bacterium]|nr:ribosomal-processing cysteine protease Prp [Erysipelotrichales bacterium]